MDNVTVPSPRSSDERAQPAPADNARQCKDAADRCIQAWHHLDRAEFFWKTGEGRLAKVNEQIALELLRPVASIVEVSR